MRYFKSSRWNGIKQQVLVLTESGVSTDDIRSRLGLSADQLHNITRSLEFSKRKDALTNTISTRVAEEMAKDIINDKARAIIKDAAIAAANKLVRIMRRGVPEERIQFEAALAILDRVGVGKYVPLNEGGQRTYTPEETKKILDSMKEATEIMNRLENGESQFVRVQQDSDGNTTIETLTTISSNDEEVKDVTPAIQKEKPEEAAIAESSPESASPSSDGQENVPTELVLPV